MKARLVLLLALTMAVPSVSRAQVTSEPGVILEATPIRIDPAAAVPLATLPRGMDVTVLAIQDGWLQIAFEDLRYGRRVGYVPRATVSFALPAPPAATRLATPTVPPPATVVAAPVAPAKPADKRSTAAIAKTTRPAAPAVASARRPAATTPSAPVRGEAAAPRATTASAPATATAIPASHPASGAVANPAAARPAVQLVEADFPNLVAPKNGAAGTLPPTGTTAAAATSRATGKPAPRPPVRLVEAEFPDLVTPSKKPAATPAPRSVVSIGNAFPDAAGSPASTPATSVATGVATPSVSAQPAVAKPAPRPPVRLVHAEFPAIASASPAAVDEEDKPTRAVVSIGDAFPAITESPLPQLTARDAVGDINLSKVDGHLYVAVDMGADARVFDGRASTVETTAARVLTQTLLPKIRAYAKAMPPVPGARGIHVVYRIPLQGSPGSSTEYRLELVADMPHVVAFAVAGTTDQAFVAGSTVRVDGNDIRVNLAAVTD